MNNEPDSMKDGVREMHTLTGLAVSRGFAAGAACLFRSVSSEPIPDYRITPEQVKDEMARLAEAFSLTRGQIRSLARDLKKRIDGDEAAIFDGHLMILDDPSFIGGCEKKIANGLCNAESAVKQMMEQFASVFSAMGDSYLRERAQDISDIAKRIIRNLSGGQDTQMLCIEQPCIVVADELSPSETISLPKSLILGFATDRGSATSHASLLARALGLPAVAGLGSISQLAKSGDTLLLDGTHGKVIINPGEEERAAFDKMMAHSQTLEKSFSQNQSAHGQTADGHAVPFLANVDPSTPLADLSSIGTEGIGLYRTEYLWLREDREPSEDEQANAYTAAVKAMQDGQTVTIRALDLGGDKITKSSGKAPHKKAAFLDSRSLRYLLQTPDVFRRQLRAVLRASAHGNVRIMYPMVSALEELRAANAELRVCMDELKAQGIPFDETIKRGVMIETPAAALIADALAKECDFFSIGTNDLIQYTLAVDRVNDSGAQLYQPAHPAVLRLMELTVQAAHAHGLPVSVCGETAADPVLAVLFVGMGVDKLSMSPSFIRLVKTVISHITLADAKTLAEAVRGMSGSTADEVYAFCRKQVTALAPDPLYF